MDNKYLESMEELGLQSGFTLEELKKKWRELSKNIIQISMHKQMKY